MKVTVISKPKAIAFSEVDYDQAFIMAEEHDNTIDGRADICWKDPDNDLAYYRLQCGLGTLQYCEMEEPEEEMVYLVGIQEVRVVLI